MLRSVCNKLVREKSDRLDRLRRDQHVIPIDNNLAVEDVREVVTETLQKRDAGYLFCRIGIKVAMNLCYRCNAIGGNF